MRICPLLERLERGKAYGGSMRSLCMGFFSGSARSGSSVG